MGGRCFARHGDGRSLGLLANRGLGADDDRLFPNGWLVRGAAEDLRWPPSLQHLPVDFDRKKIRTEKANAEGRNKTGFFLQCENDCALPAGFSIRVRIARVAQFPH